MRGRLVTVLVGLLPLVASIAPAGAFQAEVKRYYDALVDICRTGVTAEITRAYEEARQAVDKARYGSGRDNNFWGVQRPEQAWTACWQGPGDRD